MRRFLSWPAIGLLVVLALVGVELAVLLGRTQPVAAPVPQTIAGPSRDAPGPSPKSGPARHVSPTPRAFGKPHQLFLKRAHSAVFDVRKLKSVVVKKERPEREDPLGGEAEERETEMPSVLEKDQMVQRSGVSANAAAPAADSSFDGLDFATWGAGHPPDENGDVGPTYYIQTVNTSLGIYNKSTGVRVAAFTFDVFMSQGNFGNLCDTDNFGDPVVLYDSYEDRWMITDFAFKLDGSGNVNPQTVYECFAVSKTGDPVSGGWNYYSILSPDGLADYPKFGIWPDGIYMSANMFGYASSSGYQGTHMWALNKQEMYANAPQVSVVDFAGGTDDFTVIPVNSKLAAGTPPPARPAYFVSTWNFLNAVEVYRFKVNWDKISTSTFTGPFQALAPNCWPNASVPSAQTPQNAADVLQIRAMAAPQYTNLSNVESLWVAHTVRRGVSATNTTCDAPTTGNATIRWYQLNVTGNAVGGNVLQGSSFDPEGANTYYRFQPAVAVDHAGNMAVTYTKSNSTTNPSIMYTGRLAGDTPNTLQTEATLIAGTGAQTGNCGASACVRWGDYAGMELDPNGCEFWMTGEYYATNSLNNLTRIGSFHFPGCTPLGNGTLSGTVTDGASPIAGAVVTLGSRTTTTNGSGAYSFTVPAGTYSSLTVDKPGYTQGTAASLTVPNAGTLTKNFTLSAAAQSGCIVDTTQSDFQRGLPSTGTCDLTSSPGDVRLVDEAVVDQKNETLGVNGAALTTTTWGGQTFTPAITGPLTKVDLNLFCSGCTGTTPNLTVSIRATSGGLPTDTPDLATGTITGFSSGSGGNYTAAFASPITVTAGTQYAILVRPTANPSPGTYALTRSGTPSAGSDVYAGGTRIVGATSGTAWSVPLTGGTSTDAGFHTWVHVGFSTSGTFVSSLKDANPVAGSIVHWTTLSWAATTPANTAVKFQVAASNSKYGPWSYVGPNGTASTFFTTTGASLSQFNGKRYLRYEAFLSTSDSSVTPTLSSVSTCFMDVPVPTTLAAASATGQYGGTTTISATLTADGNGVAGKTVSFTLNGSSIGGTTTDANGVATLPNVSLSGIAAGSYPTGVAASFAGDSNYKTSSGTNSLTVSKADQSITFATPADRTYGNADFDPGATASSGLAVSYQASGACSAIGGLVHLTGAGSCSVTASQAGNGNYNAAPQEQRTFTVAKAALTITANDRQKFLFQALALGTTAFTPSGLVGADSVAGVTFTSSGAGASAARGDYPIVPSQAVSGPSTDLAANYTIAYANGTLHVLAVGIVGLNGVSVKTTKGKIDSFDSSAGAYGSSNHGSAAIVVGNGLLSFAGVVLSGSVASMQGSVSVAGTAKVSGDVTAGTTASIFGQVGGSVTQSAPSSPLSLPTVAKCSPHSSKAGISGGKFLYSASTGNLTVKSGTVKLASKTYCFNNVTLATGSTLQVSGPVTIRLSGKLSGKGHLVNKTDLPGNLHIDSSFTGSTGIAIAGGSHAAMKILAPKTTVTVSGGSFFGTLFAGAVKLTGTTAFHADMH